MTGPYRTTLTGPFPRSEALVQATRDLDRGRISAEQAQAAFTTAEAEVRAVEADLALDCRTGGYLGWPDLFRPFTQIWGGVTAGPLTRFFETNTFYRQPVFRQPPAPGKGRLADWLPRGADARAILPGPYTFARLAQVDYRGRGPSSPILEIATALAADLRALGNDRPGHLQFQEPSLAYAPPADGWDEVTRAYGELAAAAGSSNLSVWTYFGDLGPSLRALASLPVGVLGFDLFATTFPSEMNLGDKAIGVGCLDPTTTIAEDHRQVVELVRRAEAKLHPRGVWLGPNPPLDLLPFASAVTKLRALPTVKEALSR